MCKVLSYNIYTVATELSYGPKFQEWERRPTYVHNVSKSNYDCWKIGIVMANLAASAE